MRERQPFAFTKKEKADDVREANIDKTGEHFDNAIERLTLLIKNLKAAPENQPYSAMLDETQTALNTLVKHTLPRLSHHKLDQHIQKEFDRLKKEFNSKARFLNLSLPKHTHERMKDKFELTKSEIEHMTAQQAFTILVTNAKYATVKHATEMLLDYQQQRQKKPIDIKALKLKPAGNSKFTAAPTHFDRMYEEGSSQEFKLADANTTLIISDTSVNMKEWNQSGVDSYAKAIIEQANKKNWNPTYLNGSVQQVLSMTKGLREHGMNKPIVITEATIRGFQNEVNNFIHNSKLPPLLNAFSTLVMGNSEFYTYKKQIFINMAIINNTPHPALGEKWDNPVNKAAVIIDNIHRKHGDSTFNTVTRDECAKQVIAQELQDGMKDINELPERYAALYEQLQQGTMSMKPQAFMALIPPNHHQAFISAHSQRQKKANYQQLVAQNTAKPAAKDPTLNAENIILALHQQLDTQQINQESFTGCARLVISRELEAGVTDTNELMKRYLLLSEQLHGSPLKLDPNDFIELIPPQNREHFAEAFKAQQNNLAAQNN